MIDLAEFKRMFRGGLLLEDAAFEELAAAPNGVARGLKFIVTVALAVGLVVALAGFVQAVTTTPAREIEQAMDGVTQVFDQLGAFGMFEDEAVKQNVLDNVKAGMAMGLRIAGVVEDTTPAPMAAVSFIEALGKWLSWPFSWISLWLLWGVLTLLFARMIGGTATIQRMLAVTSLVVAPHVLDALGWVTCAGGLVGLVAWIWGFVVYVKATAVANRFGAGAALLVVVLPIGIPVFLGIAFIFLIALLAGGGSN
jgi:hypothetical protein